MYSSCILRAALAISWLLGNNRAFWYATRRQPCRYRRLASRYMGYTLVHCLCGPSSSPSTATFGDCVLGVPALPPTMCCIICSSMSCCCGGMGALGTSGKSNYRVSLCVQHTSVSSLNSSPVMMTRRDRRRSQRTKEKEMHYTRPQKPRGQQKRSSPSSWPSTGLPLRPHL